MKKHQNLSVIDGKNENEMIPREENILRDLIPGLIFEKLESVFVKYQKPINFCSSKYEKVTSPRKFLIPFFIELI